MSNGQPGGSRLEGLRNWLTPGIGVKRYVGLAFAGALLLIAGTVGLALWLYGDERSALSDPIEDLLTSPTWYSYGVWVAVALAVAGSLLAAVAVAALNRSLLSHWLPHPTDAVRLVSAKTQLAKGPRVVALGGGSGLSNLLRGLRQHTSNITAVVAVSDTGGSSGRLRDAYDMPAPGDLTDCLAALSDNESELAELLQYRFSSGPELAGHTFGNLLVTTLTQTEGDFGQATRSLNRLLKLSGHVYPATVEPVTLIAEKGSAGTVVGEAELRELPGAVTRLTIEPAIPSALPEVLQAIGTAELLVLGPGSLFSSTLPPVLVPAVRDAVNASSAKLVFVVNIMTERGETDGFDAYDHVAALTSHGVRRPDVVLTNSTVVDDARLRKYAEDGSELVVLDPAPFENGDAELMSLPLLGAGAYAQHDSEELANVLVELAQQRRSKHAKTSSPGRLAS